MKILKNKGFSLVQVMVGLGLTGLVGLGVMNQLDNLRSNTARVDKKIELDTFLDNITKTISSKKVCDFNFSGKDVNSGDPLTLYADTSSKVLLTEGGEYLSGAIKVDSIRLSPITGQDSQFNLSITARKVKETKSYNLVKRNIKISASMTGTVVNNNACYFKSGDVADIDTICKGPGVDVNSSSGERTCYFQNFELNPSTLVHSCEDGYLLSAIAFPMTSANPYEYLSVCKKTFSFDPATCGSSTTKRVRRVTDEGIFECFNEADRFDNSTVTFNSTASYKLIVNTDNKIQLALASAASTSCPSGTVSCTPSCSGSWTETVTTPGTGSCSGNYSIGGGSGSCQKNNHATGDPGGNDTEVSAAHCYSFDNSSDCNSNANQYLSHIGTYFSCSWSGSSGTVVSCANKAQSSCESQSGCTWNPSGGGTSTTSSYSCAGPTSESACTTQNSNCSWNDCGGSSCSPITATPGGSTCTPDPAVCNLDPNDPGALCIDNWVQNGVNNCGDSCTFRDNSLCNNTVTPGGTGTGSGTGSTGCFVADTKVSMFDNTFKPIIDVKIGDSILSPNGKPAKVLDTMIFDHNAYKYSLNGSEYFVTESHPFKTIDGWKSFAPQKSMKQIPEITVSKLKAGDILLTDRGYEALLSIDKVQTNEKVYNITVDGVHEFIADGYYVHNKVDEPNCPGGSNFLSCNHPNGSGFNGGTGDCNDGSAAICTSCYQNTSGLDVCF